MRRHDIDIQKVRIKAEKSHGEQECRLKSARKELLVNTSKVAKLENVIEELREEAYISADDAKSLNVISYLSLSLSQQHFSSLVLFYSFRLSK